MYGIQIHIFPKVDLVHAYRMIFNGEVELTREIDLNDVRLHPYNARSRDVWNHLKNGSIIRRETTSREREYETPQEQQILVRHPVQDASHKPSFERQRPSMLAKSQVPQHVEAAWQIRNMSN